MTILHEDGCPKCGATDMNVVFHKQGCSNGLCSCATCIYGSHTKEHLEHLHVTCRRCHFDWVSPTLPQLAALRDAGNALTAVGEPVA